MRPLRANDFVDLEPAVPGVPGEPPERMIREPGMAGTRYASVFYSHFAAAAMDVRAEESTARGRSDLAILYDGSVYLFKAADGKPKERAPTRIRERGYADKYRRMPIHLIGVEFGREERNGLQVRNRLKPGSDARCRLVRTTPVKNVGRILRQIRNSGHGRRKLFDPSAVGIERSTTFKVDMFQLRFNEALRRVCPRARLRRAETQLNRSYARDQTGTGRSRTA